MTDLDTGAQRSRPRAPRSPGDGLQGVRSQGARPQASPQAKARLAAARQRRAAEVAGTLPRTATVDAPAAALIAASAADQAAMPFATSTDVTTELERYVDPAPDVPDETAPSAPRRVQTSLARLDAVAAARPLPDTAIGLDFFAPVVIRFKQPLLVRLLRLRHVRPTGWQRAAVGDVPILVAVLLVLADLATAWTLLVLPLVVLLLVKFHDIIESRLAPVPVVTDAERPFGEATDL